MADYYIATTGNDTTGTGTSANPWLTFGKFVSSSAAGDTCYAAAGTYTMVAMTFTGRTLIGAALVDGFPTTIFDGAGGTVGMNTFGGTCAVSNVWFTNWTETGGASNRGVFHFGVSGQNTVCTITNCVFSDITFQAVNGGGLFNSPYDATSTTATFLGCLVYDIHYTYVSGTDNAVFRLSAQNNAGTFTLRNCTVRIKYVTTTDPVIIFGAQDIKSQWYLYNNIFVDYGTASPTFSLVANRIAGASNNIVYGFSSVPTMTGTISSDPLFVDTTTDNFNLKTTSPGVFGGVFF